MAASVGNTEALPEFVGLPEWSRASCPSTPASRFWGAASDMVFRSAYCEFPMQTFLEDCGKSVCKEGVVLGGKQFPKESVSSLKRQKGGRFS